MSKKIKIIIFSLISLFVFFFIYTGIFFRNIAVKYGKPTTQCTFCNQRVIDSHMFYEDDYVRGLCTYNPIKPWHCMVVVKRHVERFEDITDKELLAVGKLLKKINIAVTKIIGPVCYMIFEKNGKGIQLVPHVHFHYLPETASYNPFIWFGYLRDFILSIFTKPMNMIELKNYVDRMKLKIQTI